MDDKKKELIEKYIKEHNDTVDKLSVLREQVKLGETRIEQLRGKVEALQELTASEGPVQPINRANEVAAEAVAKTE